MEPEIGKTRHKHMHKPCVICGATITVHFVEEGRALVTHNGRRLADGTYSEITALAVLFDDMAHEIEI